MSIQTPERTGRRGSGGMIPPDRSLAQRRQALQRANQIRSERAKLKPDLKAGRRNGVALLLDPPEWMDTMTVIALVLAMPKYGRVKANKVLNAARVSPRKTIGGMTERQRLDLARALGYEPERMFR